MLYGADVTNVDDRESIVELAAIGLSVFCPYEGGGGGGATVIRFAIWKMSNGDGEAFYPLAVS